MRPTSQLGAYVAVAVLTAVVTYIAHAPLRAERDQLEAELLVLRGDVPRAGASAPERALSESTAGAGVSAHLESLPPESASASSRPRVRIAEDVAPPRPAGQPAPQLRGPAPAADAEATVSAVKQRLAEYVDLSSDMGIRDRIRHGRALLNELRDVGPVATDALLEALQGAESSRERSVAAALLGGLQDPSALPVLTDLIETDQDVMVRRGAARGLRLMDDTETIPVLTSVVGDPDEDRFVRYNAAYGLAQLGQPEGVASLVGIFEETAADGRGRGWVFRTLVRLDDPGALPVMRSALHGTADISMRIGAIEFLGRHGSSEDVPALQQVLAQAGEAPALAEAVDLAVRRLGGR